MKSLRARALLVGGTASLLLAIPAFSQENQGPESLLPPGFGDPQNLPPPVEKTEPQARPQTTRAPPAPAARRPAEVQETRELSDEELEQLERLRPTNYFSIPQGVARPVDAVGLLAPGNFGLPANAFGGASGPFLATLMHRLDAPLPSRWASILLRRVLLSRLEAPAGIHPVDFVAARADLLLRLGEADAARMLVQSVDREFYTPRMLEVAAQTALATADPAGLCPLVDDGARTAAWKLSEAMCAALEGEPARSSSLVDEARRQGGVSDVDVLLAQKVIGAGPEARRAASIRWEEVDALSPWRLGLASATGAEIPAQLVGRASLPMQAWYARSPMIPVEQRLGAASIAASLGVFSSRSLAELYSLAFDATDIAEQEGTVGARLRAAWTERDPGERLEALRALWDEGEGDHGRHARLILTSGAAARIPAVEDFAADSANLVASMFAGGYDREAARWGAVVEDGGNDRGWAMLAVGAPSAVVDVSAGRVRDYIGGDESAGRRRSQLLVAALAGLGRIGEGDVPSLASELDLRLGGDDRWSAAIDRAARDREPGTVVLLTAVGMQTGGWRGVPPQYLFRALRALRTVGLEFEARMIAAEAMARL
ncbi:MAG TPA: hypothetical protein VF704_10345 [Allosphingosinicella sp.]